MTEQNRDTHTTSLLVGIAAMFTTGGVAIGIADSYGVLSFTFLGLGVVLSVIAVVRSVEEDDVFVEE